MHRKDDEKCRVTSGQNGVFMRRRALPPPSDGGAGRRGRRCNAFSTSEVKVSREWPRKITAKKREKEKNERYDVSLVSKFETPLRDHLLSVVPSFASSRPVCRLYSGRNKVYSFRDRPLLVPLLTSRRVKRFSRSCKKRD